MAIKTASGSRLSGALPAGLVLLNTTSFSAVSAQAVNNVFTSSYENYRFILTISAASTNLDINMRMRVSGTSDSGTNYGSNGSSSTSSALSNINLGSTSFFLTSAFGTEPQYTGGSGDILLPQTTQKTRFNFATYGLTSAGANLARHIAGVHALATSYDGIEILTSTGNITGTVRIYGYNQ